MKRKLLVKRIFLTLGSVAGYILLLPVWRFLRTRVRPEYRVLNYHSVGDERPYETNVSCSAFEAHIRCIAKTGCAVDLQACLAGASVPRHALAVTMDDGYADNLTNAAPILKKYQVPSTCFITAGYIGTNKRLPHDAADDGDASRLLTWKEVAQLGDYGVTVGSHGLNHVRLAHEEDAVQEIEFEESKAMIETKLSQPVALFSYPYGRYADFNDLSCEIARRTGYAAAATAMYGWNTRATDPFRLSRIGVDASDTLFTLQAKLHGALDWLILLESSAARRLVKTCNRMLGV